MELGATVCKPQNPDCNKCPLNSICIARELVARRNELISEIDFASCTDDSIRDIEDLVYKQVKMYPGIFSF